MKGDFTRFTFDPEKHYSSVRMQQGRVQLDADTNEFTDIMLHRDRVMTQDLIGESGGPEGNDGFKIALNVADFIADLNLPPEEQEALKDSITNRLTRKEILPLKGFDFLIGKGRYYVDGILCENEDYTSLIKQPDLEINIRGPSPIYIVYLDVWERHITAIDDQDIKEIALGGSDTTTRTKTVWQVKLLRLKGPLENSPCGQVFEEWNNLTAIRNSRMKAQINTGSSSSSSTSVPSGDGYTGLTNQLYRVEIHRSGKGDKATFKWSKDNGSVVRAITEIKESDKEIVVENTDQDLRQAFAGCLFMEITDDYRELNELPGTLVRLVTVKDTDKLAFEYIATDVVSSTTFPLERKPKVRRWDQIESAEIKVGPGPIPLEHEIEVCFSPEDDYHTGDYWLIPVRAGANLTRQIEWETWEDWENWEDWEKEKGQRKMVQRFGVEHHYCRLAVVKWTDRGFELFENGLGDCRTKFPSAVCLENTLKDMLNKPSGGCMVTVGAGGNYTSLDVAIRELIKGGYTDISICLLPGDHEILKDLRIVDISDIPSLKVHITGGGRGTRILLGELCKHIDIEHLASFSLTGVDMIANEYGQVGVNPLTIMQCGDVVIRNCRLLDKAGSGTLLTINGAQSITIEDSTLEIYSSFGMHLHYMALSGEPLIQNLFKLDDQYTDRSVFIQESLLVAGKIAKDDALSRNQITNNLSDSFNEKAIKPRIKAFRYLYTKLNDSIMGGDPHRIAARLIEIFDATAKVNPLTALAIKDSIGDTILSNNKFGGFLNLYGGEPDILGNDDFDYLYKYLGNNKISFTTDVDEAYESDRVYIEFGANSGTLRLQGNRLISVRCGSEFINKLRRLANMNGDEFKANLKVALNEIFRQIVLEDNIIEIGENFWVASEVIFTANRFNHLDTQTKIGSVIAQMSIYMGNSSRFFSEKSSCPELWNATHQDFLYNKAYLHGSQNVANILFNIVDYPW